MSLLKELIPGYESMSDEEIDEIIMTGRIAREESAAPKKTAAKKTKASNLPEVNIDDYD